MLGVCVFQGNMDSKELLNVGGTQVTRAFMGVYVFFWMFFSCPQIEDFRYLFKRLEKVSFLIIPWESKSTTFWNVLPKQKKT